MWAAVNGELLTRYAKLIVEVGTNVQPGQNILMIGAPTAAPLMRAVAAEAYARGARFFDPWYFDPQVKRIRAETADPDSLEFIPSWYPERIRQLGEGHGVADLGLADRPAGADGRRRSGRRRTRPAAEASRASST